MTFKQLVWKMAKVNKRKYIFYFLCNSFAVVIFFMFSTLYLNENITENEQLQKGMDDILLIPATALLIFTVFFISYAHSIFIKRRRKEFALFMTLGMTYRDLVKLLLLENGAIALASLVVGLLSGSVFSRLFFLVLMSNVDMADTPFYLNGMMFLYTVGLFLLVFIAAVGKTLFITGTHELVNSLKEDRTSDKNNFNNPYIGAAGLLIMIASMAILYLFTYEKKFNLDQTIFRGLYEIGEGTYFILCTVGLFLGLYLTFSQFGSFLIQYAKRYPDFYYRRLLIVTNIDYKFKQLKSTFLLIIIMAMVTIFYSTLTLFFYSSAERLAEELPFDIAFVQTETKNNITRDELFSILDNENHSINEYLLVETFDYFEPHPSVVDFIYRYTFMSVENFNRLSSQELQIREGGYVYLVNSSINNIDSDFTQGLKFSSGQNTVTLTIQEIVNEPILDYRIQYYNPHFIIVNEEDYTRVKSIVDVYTAKFHWVNVTNWKQTTEAVSELKQKLLANNQITPPLDETLFTRISYSGEQDFLKPVSKVDEYNLNKKGGGIIFFVSTFLSILFFFASFILVYLNVFTDIEQEKRNYRKLYKIGITKKEIEKIISQELFILFFLAPLVGILIGYVYIATFAQDGGGIMSIPSLIVNFLTIGGIYLSLQTIYYIFARKRYLKELLD
ncbi:ABC transporter permease [Alkalihalobacterium chitinilyticum]|uniref:ABC transporter permease n=1 Tax=Alkalihalobacterium chitinilyticum TaxID=2980103 RepID=A0ABT5VJA6_9BACI|nr:ABC transporter permease [Alkalihalobacterium chitinilyticum]MDE5414329.1 ABC transporter permease [Alkalihalobacterium chitinilyticum]